MESESQETMSTRDAAVGLAWTEETRALVLPRRSHGLRAPLPADGAAAELVRSILELRRTTIAAGVQHAADDAKLLQQQVVSGVEADLLSEEAAAACALLLTYEPDPRADATTGPVLSAALVDAWIERYGAAFAVRACAATSLLGVRRHPTDGSLVLIRHKAMQTGSAQNVNVERRWKALRRRLATMPDEAYAEAREAAEALRADAPIRLAISLIYAFPDEKQWSAEVARDVLSGSAGGAPRLPDYVLRSLADRVLVEKLVEKYDNTAEELAPCAFDIADALGVEAETALCAIASCPGFEMQYGLEEQWRAAVNALALLPTPRAAEWLVARLDDKVVRRAATTLFVAAPKVGIAALAQRIASKGAPKKASEHAQALLASIVRTAPDEARIASAELEASAAKLVADLVESSVVTEEAVVSELPPVLASPPWATTSKHAKKSPKKKAAKLGELPLLPFDEALVWTDIPKPGAANVTSRANDAQVATLEKNVKDGETISFREIAELSNEAAQDVFTRFPAEAWEHWWLGRELAQQVARFGVAAIEPCLRFAKKKPADVAVALEAASSPRVAPVMAHVLARVKKQRRTAERWLVRNPRAAAIGLISELLGGGSDPRAQDNAGRALRFLASRGKRAIIDEVAREYGSSIVEAIEVHLSADLLGSGAPSKPPKMPSWFEPAALPRPRLAGSKKALPIEAVKRLGEMLAFTDPEEPYIGLEEVREACDPESLGEFAWGVFQAWSLAGYPMDEKWAFFAIGHLGRDEHAHRLAPIIRAWPTEGAFPRAVIGLEVLGTMKSDVSLMLLHGISEKVKSRPLLAKAKEKLESVAESLGVRAEELADRLVPTLGLDDDGSRILDFGSRSFRVGFDEDLRPFVQLVEGGQIGARLADLPKPNKSDDRDLGAKAHEEWKALKKAAKVAAAQQIARFETSMIARRRWEPSAFTSYLAGHPLVRHLVRRLVWGLYDDDDVLVGTFRVAEDGSLADEDDASFVVPEGARIGVAHPIEIEPSTLAKWGERFSDYELVQPFPQLGRDVPRKTTTDLDNLTPVDSLKLLGLERRGWRRGPVGDGGVVWQLEKEAGALRASLTIEPGLYAFDPTLHPTQTPQALDFADARRGPVQEPDVIFVSEVAADLRAVGALA